MRSNVKAPARARGVVEPPKLVDDIDTSVIHSHLGFKLRMAQVAVFRHFVIALKPFDLRPSYYSALSLIATNPGVRQQRIGEALEIQRPNLVLLIGELVQRGWIVRKRVLEDKRSYALFLTESGTQLLRQVDIAHAQHQKRVEAAIGKDLPAFTRALSRLHDTLG